MDYEFQISPYNNPLYIQQISYALEKRTESISREKYPQMWKITDYFNSKKVSESVLKKRRFRSRIYGALLIIMGVFLLVPGLMEPQELAVPLFAGIFGLLIGVFTLWSSKAQKLQSRRFNQAAVKLLKIVEPSLPVHVHFTQDGMKIADQQMIPYPDFNFVCETKDLFLLTWNEQITILQKKDLVTGDKAQFTSFLQDHIKIMQL